ncbi:MAG: urease accessory protein UreF [Beijerinckiaceae bacterium]
MNLARLLTWFSPAFPIGAFSFSHGLEWAVEADDVRDRETLRHWIETLILTGSGWSDAVLFANAHRAVERADKVLLTETAELAIALQPSRERRLESTMQGDAFVRAVAAGWENGGLSLLQDTAEPPYALTVATGAATAGESIAIDSALTAFLTGFAQHLVSAAVRLAPIGQSDGLAVMAGLEAAIASTVKRAAGATLDEVGGIGIRSDICSMRHETQMTRLFRS